MTTTKLGSASSVPTLAVEAGQIQLRLADHEVVVRKNGVEFLSTKPMPLWTEVTVNLESALANDSLRANGVVVDCTGNRHTGYTISVLFLELPLDSREHLRDLALASAT